jgi:hypothetical protein
MEAIRPELRGSPAPPPRDDLLGRILSSRSAGTRVILPDAYALAARPRRHLVLAVVAAAILLLILPVRRGMTPTLPANGLASGERSVFEWTSIAFAQTEPRDSRAELPAMAVSRADRLRPAALEYERTWRDSLGRLTGRLAGEVTNEADTIYGVPAWRLVSRNAGVRNGRTLTTVDTVLVAREDLRLLRRTALEYPYSRYDEIRIVQTFHGDSVVGRMNAKGADASAAGRPIARLLRPSRGPYIADAFAPVLLGAVDLRAGWTGSASVVGWAVVDRDVSVRIQLRVEDDEVISVPAGRFECWRLSIRAGPRVFSYWVRKADGVAVRSLERMANGERREVVLRKGLIAERTR